MKKFRFKLDTLLSVREREVECSSQRLAQANERLLSEVAKQKELEKEQGAIEDSLRFTADQKIQAREVVENLQYIDLLKKKICMKQEQVNYREKIVRQAAEKATEALQERKAIEKLKEKRYGQWKKRQVDLENADLDELATERYHKDQK